MSIFILQYVLHLKKKPTSKPATEASKSTGSNHKFTNKNKRNHPQIKEKIISHSRQQLNTTLEILWSATE